MRFKEMFFSKPVPENIKSIPIVINSFNRVSMLRQMVSWLQGAGYTNIIILDNDSTYPPLLEFYKETSCRVVYLKQNLGFMALWKSRFFKEIRNNYYVYTDSDILGVDECPDNFMEIFYNLMKKYKWTEKVGFGLKIDDLPDHFDKKDEVAKHEEFFWRYPLEKDVYRARIDTTFALYRPFHWGGHWLNGIRTAGSLSAKHLPWYFDSSKLTEEDEYYFSHCKAKTHWSKFLKK